MKEGRRLLLDMQALVLAQAQEAETAVTTLRTSSSGQAATLKGQLHETQALRTYPPAGALLPEPLPPPPPSAFYQAQSIACLVLTAYRLHVWPCAWLRCGSEER